MQGEFIIVECKPGFESVNGASCKMCLPGSYGRKCGEVCYMCIKERYILFYFFVILMYRFNLLFLRRSRSDGLIFMKIDKLEAKSKEYIWLAIKTFQLMPLLVVVSSPWASPVQ